MRAGEEVHLGHSKVDEGTNEAQIDFKLRDARAEPILPSTG
jgi:hypothetical protein